MASPIYTVDSSHFSTTRSTDGSLVLTTSIREPTVVYFMMQASLSPPCKEFTPVFMSLAARETRVRFVVYDVKADPKVPRESLSTSKPIKKVPTLFMFFNGQMVGVINSRNPEDIISTINEVLSKIGRTDRPQIGFTHSSGGAVAVAPGRIGGGVTAPSTISGGGKEGGGVYKPNDLSFTGAPAGMQLHAGNDNSVLSRPTNVVPYNQPWEATFGMIEQGDVYEDGM